MDFICENCRALLNESELDYVSNKYGQFYKREMVCPKCRSAEISYAVTCDCCGNEYSEYECDDICEECKEKAASDWRIIYEAEKQIGDAEQIFVNPLIYAVLGEDTIEEILEKVFFDTMRSASPPDTKAICRELIGAKKREYADVLPELLKRKK